MEKPLLKSQKVSVLIRIYWQDLEAIVEALNKINEDSK